MAKVLMGFALTYSLRGDCKSNFYELDAPDEHCVTGFRREHHQARAAASRRLGVADWLDLSLRAATGWREGLDFLPR
ncbi:MAG: hypothetical protein N3J91_10710 [Verrucomicrobiae bacterium]|nr:hypothetical protein [Verrucomicrobiae bacterium]